MSRGLRALCMAGWVAIAAPAGAATVYVAAEGTDSGGCGAKTSPCRSISRGIDVAGVGDTVLVGPGVYGDVNNDGALDDPGDEIYVPPPCFCAIQVDKAVTIVSEAGAAATIIDVAGIADVAVAIDAAGVTFGRRSGGFTVLDAFEVGIQTNATSTGAKIAGNVVSGSNLYNLNLGGGSGHRAEDNRLNGGASQNIRLSSTATTLARNVATGASVGIVVNGAGATLTDDVSVGNETGVFLNVAATLDRVSVLGNTTVGISVDAGALTMRGGRVVGNDPTTNCGVTLNATASLDASGVWFGAAAGPGIDPADAICESGQTVVVEKNPKKPAKLKLKPQR